MLESRPCWGDQGQEGVALWLVVAGEACTLKAHAHMVVNGWMDGWHMGSDDERGEGLFLALPHGHVDRQTDRERSVAMSACRRLQAPERPSQVVLSSFPWYARTHRQTHLTVYATDLLSSVEMLPARPAVFCQFTRAARRWLRGSPLSLTSTDPLAHPHNRLSSLAKSDL